MCQAIPRKVLQVGEGRVEVLIDCRPTWVATPSLPDLSLGEYVTVYAGVALERIAEADALELLNFLEAMEAMFETEDPLLPAERGAP